MAEKLSAAQRRKKLDEIFARADKLGPFFKFDGSACELLKEVRRPDFNKAL